MISPLRRPLSAAALRALYEAAPSPELATALWEIDRLHAVIREAFRRADKGSAHPELAENLFRMGAQELAEEPCVRAQLDAEWQHRDHPDSRYHNLRHVALRPPYRPPMPPDKTPKTLGERADAIAAADRGEPPPLPMGSAGNVLRPGNRYIAK